jgi:hypothetical protein
MICKTLHRKLQIEQSELQNIDIGELEVLRKGFQFH